MSSGTDELLLVQSIAQMFYNVKLARDECGNWESGHTRQVL